MAAWTKFPRGLALVAVSIWAMVAHAGGVATLEMQADGGVQVLTYEFKGDEVRMALPAESAEGYLLVTGGAPYVVMTGEDAMVLDLRQSMQMLGGAVSLPDTPGRPDELHRLEATGQRETVAGIPGEVYQLTYTEDGQRKTETVVLSDDRRALAFSRAFTALSFSMAEAAGSDLREAQKAFDQALEGKGMLRMGDQFRLTRYRDETPDPERFRLPSAPMDLSNMPGMQGLMNGGGGASAEGGAGINFGGLFGRQAERQQQRVEDRAEAEVDEAADSAVDKALDKAFQKLFGN